MKCPNCNAELADGSVRCTACGGELAPPAEAAATPPAEAVAQPVETAAQPAPPEESKGFFSSLFGNKDEDEPKQPDAQGEQKEKDEPSLEKLTKPAGALRFLGVLLVLTVPILNIIMLFKWAFGWGVNKNIRNYARAALLYALIMLALFIVLKLMDPDLFTKLGGFVDKIATWNLLNKS